jgi:hydroxymethylpyrimidine pyrophosphatase-like HAD family hydrolase
VRRFRASGRKLFLVTGRQFTELKTIFPEVDEFDAVVAENGSHVRWPAENRDELIGQPPPPEFMNLLAKQGVTPIASGHVIVATFEPYEKTVLETIKTLGLELQVLFNKGAVMVLPSGINKASGLKRVLKQLDIKPAEVAAVGDAENDHALFDYCGFSAAVANALPSVKEHAKWVLQKKYGGGVAELVDLILDAKTLDPGKPS